MSAAMSNKSCRARAERFPDYSLPGRDNCIRRSKRHYAFTARRRDCCGERPTVSRPVEMTNLVAGADQYRLLLAYPRKQQRNSSAKA